MFGLGPYVVIGGLILTALIPAGYQVGHWRGASEQAATDRVQADLESARAVAQAVEKARDDAATITLRQVEATQRERENRKAAETRVENLEAEAIEKDKKSVEFICPPVVLVAPAPNTPAPSLDQKPTPPPVSAVRRCELDSGDMDWLKKSYPPGPIHPRKPR